MLVSKKNNNILGHLIQLLLLAIWIVFCVLAFGNRLPFLANNNLRFYEVMSGSMSPAIPAGSVIKSGAYNLELLKEGDVISFQSQGGAIVTHRIAEVKKNEVQRNDGGSVVEYRFVTKGDANESPDSEIVGSGQILGLYKWQIPLLGYVTSVVKTTQGFVTFVIVPGVFIVILELWLLVLDIKKDLERKADSHITHHDVAD